jgi:kelch-like protein 12
VFCSSDMDESRNIYLEKLSAAFSTFRESSLLCDTVLVTPDCEMPAHSVILAAASPVFRSAFQTSCPNANGSYRVELPSVSGAVMESLLFLIYRGSLKSSDKDSANLSILSETCEQLGIKFAADFVRNMRYEWSMLVFLCLYHGKKNYENFCIYPLN